MLNFKRALSTSALCLSLAGMAAADGNQANLDQTGNGNDALVTQSGDNNRAGAVADSTSTANAMEQDGNGNDLNVDQSGDNNQLGVRYRASLNQVDQIGDGNRASVQQTSDWNFVNEIQQNATTATGSNVLTIEQGATTTATAPSASFAGGSFGNTISSIDQTNTGGADNTVSVSQNVSDSSRGSYSRNRIGGGESSAGDIMRNSNLNFTQGGVSQNGAGNAADLNQDGGANLILSASQTGNDNDIDLDQFGVANRIANVTQDSSAAMTGNDAKVLQRGNNNGQGAFSSGFAGGTGVAQAGVTQIGGGNSVDYRARGDSNLFGFFQDGTDNTVGNVLIRGDGNQTAASQTGTANTLMISPIVGDDNDVGVVQNGDSNLADVALTGGSDRNAIGINQTGTNDATVTVDGSDNFADIRQDGLNSGAFGVNLNIDGNRNGLGTLSGDAGSIGLTSGVIIQDGNNNLFDTTITGNRNLFASEQTGNGNVIDVAVDGNRNQFAALQNGNSNVVNLTQTGNGNNAGITQ